MSQQNTSSSSANSDRLFAAAIVLWILGIWVTAFYLATETISDESAGVGGNSSMFASIIVTAGVMTAFSLALLVRTYKAKAETTNHHPTGSQETRSMTKFGLLVTLEAKPGKEEQLSRFLSGALPLVDEEPDTVAWFAIKIAPSTFGIFDAFPDEDARNTHLSGAVAKALMEKAPELLAKPPSIEKVAILADKLPFRS